MTSIISKIRNRLLPARPPRPLPHWPRILKRDWSRWQRALREARGGPEILLATGIGGWHQMATLDSLLAVALTLRGCRVHALLCDRTFPACEFMTFARVEDELERFAQRGVDRQICGKCFGPSREMYRELGIPLHGYGELLSPRQRKEASGMAASIPLAQIGDFRLDGLRVGEHALAGALRFFARGDLEGEPYGEPVLRRYLEASILATRAVRRLLERHPFTCASFHHGIYVPQGLVGETARHMGVRVANYVVAYRKRCFIFSHHDTYHHTMLSEPVSAWENIPWNPRLEKATLDYLASRIHGTGDWIYFHESPSEELEPLVAELGLDPDKPWVGLLTNVLWDAQLHYPANAFPGMKEWVLETIDYFGRRPELQLVIRVHPAEIRGGVPSRQLMVREIKAAFPRLPQNVCLVGPENNASTYALMERCDSVVIYGTKTGVELTSMGIPVIVGGEAWIRGKGLTLDASSREEYFALLDRLPLGKRLDRATVQRARKYAFHFFFRRMIPLGAVEPQEGKPPFRVDIAGLDDLMPGRDPGLDVICRGIMDGTPFIYPAEDYL